jgi:hypothetical protein
MCTYLGLLQRTCDDDARSIISAGAHDNVRPTISVNNTAKIPQLQRRGGHLKRWLATPKIESAPAPAHRFAHV